MTRVITSGSTATGTVTSFSAGNLSPLFTTSVANPTTTPALSFALSNANAGTIFAGPTTGAAAAPTFATSASLSGALTLGSTSPITGPILGIPVAVTGSANYGEISLGASPFDGVTAGFFVGNANGTHIAINAGSSYLGRMLDAQIAGVRMFAVGLGTVASATSAVLNSISAPAFTVTVSGNTAITTSTGFNYAELGIPTYSAASALTITNAATLAIRGAPSGGGAGPATITNAYALWVEGGASRFDSTISLSTDVILNRVNANILGLYNSTTANEFQVYGTRTDASNYERFVTRTAAGTYTIGAEAAGSGTLRPVNAVGTFWSFPVDNGGGGPSITFAGRTTTGFWSDSAPAIYTSAGGTVVMGISATGYAVASTMAVGWSSGNPSSNTRDITLTRVGAASLRFGATPSATPAAYTLTIGESSRAATDSNTAGANGTIRAGQGTGNATGTSLFFQTAIPVGSGTGAQTYTTAMTINGNSDVSIGLASLAQGATVGFPYIPTIGANPNGTPTGVTGFVPMSYDTTNHKLWVYDGGWKGVVLS